MIFANSLDIDQDGQFVGPDLDSNCFILSLIVFLKEFFEKGNLEKSLQIVDNYPAC